MKPKLFLPAWLIGFVAVFGLNGVFHSVAAASFFDSSLSAMGACVHKMKDSDPLPVALLDLILTFAMAYFITRKTAMAIAPREAAFAGALINLVSSGAWNLADRALLSVWPVKMMAVDMAWHVLLGAGGGILIAVIFNWRLRATAR